MTILVIKIETVMPIIYELRWLSLELYVFIWCLYVIYHVYQSPVIEGISVGLAATINKTGMMSMFYTWMY